MLAELSNRPTTRWIVGWSVTATLSLMVPLLVLQSGDRSTTAVWAMLGFVGMFVVGMVLGHRARPLTRYAPAVVAIGVAGAWTLYRVVIRQDTRIGGIFLVLSGFFLALVVLSAAMTFATERKWIVNTPARQRLTRVVLCALAIKALLEVVLDFRVPALSLPLTIAIFATMFWPSRKVATQS